MRESFGALPDEREVFAYTLTDGRISCDILTYGATVRAIRVPDRDGLLRDVTLGFDRLEDYLLQDAYLGATVGRCANRIGGASFPLDGKTWHLAKNDGENHLHGGLVGFDKQLWSVEEATDSRLVLSLVSPDGQEGYPGTLRVRVVYSVEDAALSIEYRAEADKATLCNLTNHAYFNLNGQGGGDVLGHTIRIFADRITEVKKGLIPTGELTDVTGTPLDLRQQTAIGAQIDADFAQMVLAGGFDHNYVLSGEGLREAAVAEGERSGIRMRVLTTQPGLQFYSGNFLQNLPKGKDGAVYIKRSGFCLEAQRFPDAPHHKNFPSAVLRPGEVYHEVTVFSFS